MDSDEHIIKLYLEGQRDFLGVLINRYIDHIYNFIFRFVRDRGRAEDLTQETFIKVWKNLHRFDPERKFKTWLFQIARNTTLDFLRKKKSINFSELEGEDGEIFEVADSGPTPHEIFEKKEAGIMIQEILDELPPKYSSVLVLYYQNQLNFREIAELSNESVDTIKSRHRRAISLVKKKIPHD
ncbi:MAG: sigma-70 family RNA polymerase sigma factor [Minisyncoccia bacterium]|jgi:RNA polymerase sigma-70 factor (ECF subfamily)